MKWISRMLMAFGIILLGVFGFQLYDHAASTTVTLEEAEQVLESSNVEAADLESYDVMGFRAGAGEIFGVLTIPKLDRSIGIVEGTDTDALKMGAGHVSSTVFPGQKEQIVISGHRDTVFRDFGELEKGDTFEVEVPYGNYEYEIYDYEIVPRTDTSIIKSMEEEVLVVTTCYPFEYFGFAPDRIAFYARPVN